jgi:hypothetical protein
VKGYIRLRARARLPADASAPLTPWEFVGHHPQLLFPSFHQPTNNVGCHLATILHVYSVLSRILLLLIVYEIRYNKYTQIAARAVRQSLKENERVAAEKRGLTALRYQHWEGGKGGEQVAFFFYSRYILTCLANDHGTRRCIFTRLLRRRKTR